MISIFFEASLYTSLTICAILFYKIADAYINENYATFKDQLQLYLMSMLFLILSRFGLKEVNLWLYQNLSIIYLSLSSYYISIKEEFFYENYSE